MTMMKWFFLSGLVAASVMALTLGCSDVDDLIDPDTGGDTCMPGRTVACACPGGAIGSQACGDDGITWGECRCPGGKTADGVVPEGWGGAAGAGATPEDWGDQPTSDSTHLEPTDELAPTDYPEPEPEPAVADEPEPAMPDVDVELNQAQIRTLVVGSTIAAEVNLDWNASGTEDLVVDIEVKSSQTYRDWTPLLRDQPASHFTSTPLGFTPGEQRFDFRAVARDGDGNSWVSNTITVQ